MASPLQTLAVLTAKVKELGFQYLPDSTVADFFATAVQEAILEELWPFRLETYMLTSAALVETGILGDGNEFGPIKKVVDTSLASAPRVLEPKEIDWLLGNGPMGQAGPAKYYYFEYVNGDKKLRVEPTTCSSLKISHFSTYGWRNGGLAPQNNTDIPKWPATHYDVLIPRVLAYCYEDSDDYDAASQQEAKYQRRLESARDQLLTPQWDEPKGIRITQDMV